MNLAKFQISGSILVLEEVICGLGRCAILFFSPEKLGLELCELRAALAAAES